MIIFGFYLRSALNNIIRNKLLSAAKLLTTFFCMSVILILIGTYSSGLSFARERCNFRNISELKMYVANEVQSLPKNPTDAEHFIFYARNSRLTFGGKYLASVGLAFTNLNFSDLFYDFFQEGHSISDPESECVIGYAVAAKYKIGVSDKISIGSKKYTVCGVSRNEGYRNTILLCDPRELEIGCPRMYISTQTVYGSGLVYNGTEIQKYFMSMSDLSDLIPVIAACVVMLIFSAVNIFNITVIYAKKSERKTQILRSLGASKKAVFAVQFIENLLINMSSFGAAFVMLILTKDMIFILFSTSLRFEIVGSSLTALVSVILSLIYSFRRFKQEAVCIL